MGSKQTISKNSVITHIQVWFFEYLDNKNTYCNMHRCQWFLVKMLVVIWKNGFWLHILFFCSSFVLRGIPSPKADNLSLVDIHQFVYERFFEAKNHKDLNELILFHTNNKYLFMAHSPNHLSKLGNLVANKNKDNPKEIFEEYYLIMRSLLQKNPTHRSHLNTIYHIFGHFSKDLTNEQKNEFLKVVENLKTNEKSLRNILLALKELTMKFDKRYLIRQTYFLLFT